MRIADKMQYNQVTANLQKNRGQESDLQNQAATQKRINKPSDDPLASARVLTARTEERGQKQFVKNIEQAKSFLEFSDQSLNELSDILVRAKELALSQSSDGSANEESRRVSAQEVEQIYNQAVQIGNRKLGERFIFGGYKTQSMPFDANGTYAGDDGRIRIQTHKDSFLTMNMPGSRVFLGKTPGSAETGATRDTAPRTVDDLRAQREATRDAREKQAIEEDNFVQTRGPSGFGRAERLSPNDPATDKRGINLFETLKGLEICMRTNDKAGIQEHLDYLDQAVNQVVESRSELGARLSTLNGNTESLQKGILDQKTLASQLEDADLFQVVSDINKTDSTLKATLETSGKVIQPTLLDFLK